MIVFYIIVGFIGFLGTQLIYHLIAGNFAPEAVAVANITGFWSWMNTWTIMLGIVVIFLPIIILALLRASSEAGRRDLQ